MPEIAYGYCHCGCGERTRPAAYTNRARGWVEGKPICYIHGHHARKRTPEYRVEDRGFETPCWIWQRALQPNGYGAATRAGKTFGAHRAYYQEFVGPIPEGTVIDHLCRVRDCVNPKHLEAVHQATNVRRGRGAKLTVEDVREIRRRRAAGELLHTIAVDFDIDISHTSQIARGIRWPEVAQ